LPAYFPAFLCRVCPVRLRTKVPVFRPTGTGVWLDSFESFRAITQSAVQQECGRSRSTSRHRRAVLWLVDPKVPLPVVLHHSISHSGRVPFQGCICVEFRQLPSGLTIGLSAVGCGRGQSGGSFLFAPASAVGAEFSQPEEFVFIGEECPAALGFRQLSSSHAADFSPAVHGFDWHLQMSGEV
jgi:hypothetical protein